MQLTSPSSPLPLLPSPSWQEVMEALAKGSVPSRGDWTLGESSGVLRKQAPLWSHCDWHFGMQRLSGVLPWTFSFSADPFPSLACWSLCVVDLYIFLLSFPFLPQNCSAQSDVSLQDGPLSQPPCREGSWTARLIFPQFLLCLDQSTLGTRKCTVQLSFCNSAFRLEMLSKQTDVSRMNVKTCAESALSETSSESVLPA